MSDRAAVKGVKTAIGNSAKPAKKAEPIRTKPARGRKAEGDAIVEAGHAGMASETADSEGASIA